MLLCDVEEIILWGEVTSSHCPDLQMSHICEGTKTTGNISKNLLSALSALLNI